MQREIFIDPSYEVFYLDKLFELEDATLNRDQQLRPFHQLREKMADTGVMVRTADYLFQSRSDGKKDYYSFGMMNDFEAIKNELGTRLAAFVIFEPPLIAPHLYSALPYLTKIFERVYVHNTTGDGYSLDAVNLDKLHKVYWPIPFSDVLLPYWGNTERMKRVVVINGSHNPRGKIREQYSLRIEAMAELSKMGVVDLYGIGWERWWSRSAMWLPYWKNRSALMRIYKGKCLSKFEEYKKYEFCLCFENMQMDGYITEKIFDCLYAGTIPLYLGAPDIENYIPKDVFIDCRQYSNWTEMWRAVEALSSDQINEFRIAGRNFLRSEKAQKFTKFVEDVCESS